MAQNFRNDLQRQIGTGDTTLVTGGDFDAVIGIRCCNVTASTIEVDVKIANGGNDFFLAKGVVIPPNSGDNVTLTLTNPKHSDLFII